MFAISVLFASMVSVAETFAPIDCSLSIRPESRLCTPAPENGDVKLLTWNDARDFCRRVIGGSGEKYRLVTMLSDDVKNELEEFRIVFDLQYYNLWIGARRPQNNSWKWVNGSTLGDG
jgi:hypothetical protein